VDATAARWWVTKAAAARKLGITPRTMNAMVRRGEISTVRIGRRDVIPKAELARVLEDWQTAS